MNVKRSWLVFFVMLLIACCIVVLAAEKPILKSWNALHGRYDGCDWQCVGAGVGKNAAAAGWEEGKLVLCWFKSDGTKLSQQRLTLPDECAGGKICRLMPVRDGLAFIGLYGPNAEKLYLYRVNGGEAECLRTVDCAGASFQERTERTKLSELTYEDDVLSFAFWSDGKIDCCICRESGGLESVGSGTAAGGNVLSVLSLQDGSILQGGAECLSMNSKTAAAPLTGQVLTHLTKGKGGWYYIDAARFELCFVDADLDEIFRLLTPNIEVNGEKKMLASVALTRDESVLMLLDGATLHIADDDGTRELSGILSAGAAGQWLTLLKFAGIALAGAILLWLLLCGLRRGYAPLAVLRGSVIVAGALLCVTALRFAVLRPAAENAARRENAAVVTAALNASKADGRWDDAQLAPDVARMLEGTKHGDDVCVVRADLSVDTWRTDDMRNAVTMEGFSSALADDAANNEGVSDQLIGEVYRFVYVNDTHSLSVRMDTREAKENKTLYALVLGGFGLLTLTALMILLTVGTDIRKISKRMELISRGSLPKPLKLPTGDELESMASVVNSMGASLKKQEEKLQDMEQSYRRFVPEKVLELFDKPSILDVDKSDFAARRMAIISVRFAFPDALYTDINNSRLLFDSVNEVIERTSAIVARKNGTALSFAYNGFDFVMEDSGEAVSTAVAIQQEILSFNELRAQNRLPAVKLHIAIDRGSFMLGIVGDASTMTPTTISTSLSVVRELIDLCGRLKAGILCTEVIVSARKDYGSRYMGKCLVGGQPVRVYEVFDGDDFNTRRGKAGSIEEFSKGIYDLYGGDPAGAKHAFLKLVHNCPLDGGARYYLHMADRMEHDPSLPCVLNFDHADGGEM